MRFSCPSCSQIMQSTPSSAGTKVGCPKYGQRVLVPSPAPTAKTTLGRLEGEDPIAAQLSVRIEGLASRVGKLESGLSACSQDLWLALRYVEPDAASSLTKSRMTLERLLIQAYVREMGREPRKPLLGDMLADNQFTRKIERRILSRMNAIRDMGNLGPHGEAVQPTDAARVLDDLCEVIEWYLHKTLGQAPADRSVASNTPKEPAVPVIAPPPGKPCEPAKSTQARRLPLKSPKRAGPPKHRAGLVAAVIALAALAIGTVVGVGAWVSLRSRLPATPPVAEKKNKAPRNDPAKPPEAAPPKHKAPPDDPAKPPETAPPKQKPAPEKYITNSIGMKLAYIPPGKFMMGSPKSEQEQVGAGWAEQEFQHAVEITKGFYMGVYAVTQEEYKDVMGKNPSWFSAGGGGAVRVAGLDTRRFPVENASWDDAKAFCRKLGEREGKTYRLPTEAEWEYACRAGTKTAFYFGDTISTDQANYNGEFVFGAGKKGVYRRRPMPVGSFPANAFGLHDMHGNVLQWCEDYYDKGYYKNSPNFTDPLNTTASASRVLRGGSWSNTPGYCRSAYRTNEWPGGDGAAYGFRVVLLWP